MLKKNDIIELNIIAMSSEGLGIGRTDDNVVVFVPNTAIGDKIKAKIVKDKKTLYYGIVDKILEKSKDRVDCDCNVFDKCGGCVYRHITYDSELTIKRQKVIDAVTRIGKLDNKLVKDIIKSPLVDAYRNKAMIPISFENDEMKMGFFSKHSHRINTCLDCKLSPEIFNDISKVVYNFLCNNKQLAYNEEKHNGYIRHLYLRLAQNTNELMVCFVVNGNSFPKQDELTNELVSKFDSIKSIIINVNTKNTNVVLGKENIILFGKGYIIDELCGLKFKISPHSFYQVNHDAAENLYLLVKEFANLSNDDKVLDLYCGTGTIGLFLANSCAEVYGIEIVQDAINDANMNKQLNGINNARFCCSDATTLTDYDTFNVVIVDPPRKGLNIELINTISSISPQRIVYVSCNPSTMARDLIEFINNDYSVEKIIPLDMFPKTMHVESVVLITRKEK